jgi:hypothetical protein
VDTKPFSVLLNVAMVILLAAIAFELGPGRPQQTPATVTDSTLEAAVKGLRAELVDANNTLSEICYIIKGNAAHLSFPITAGSCAYALNP